MKKAVLVAVFALCVCWGVAHFINLNVVTFTIAGVGITRTMLTFGFGMGLAVYLMRGR